MFQFKLVFCEISLRISKLMIDSDLNKVTVFFYLCLCARHTDEIATPSKLCTLIIWFFQKYCLLIVAYNKGDLRIRWYRKNTQINTCHKEIWQNLLHTWQASSLLSSYSQFIQRLCVRDGLHTCYVLWDLVVTQNGYKVVQCVKNQHLDEIHFAIP